MAKKKKGIEYIFVRGSNPSVVWDQAANKSLAEFCDPNTKKITGFFATRSKKVADVLRGKGYMEIGNFPGGVPPKDGFEPRKVEPPDYNAPGGPRLQNKPDIPNVEFLEDEEYTNIDVKKRAIRRRK